MREPLSPQDVRRRDLSIWPRYAAAATGLRNYWYPVMWSRDLGRKPVAIKLCDEPIMLIRENGKARALLDQCPHRGIPLSVGKQVFPCTWSCRYHGWTFNLETGVLEAALTDGPDSPIRGKVRVKTYPVEERAGLVWVYVGDAARGDTGAFSPPPVEDDIPAEFLQPNVLVVGRITIQRGNWRHACENGFDEGHAQFLHRDGALYTAFSRMPAYRLTNVVPDADGYIGRATQETQFEANYPGLGVWPPQRWWQAKGKGHRVSIRLPGLIRVKAAHQGHARFVWWTPVDKDHYRMLQFYVKPARGLAALRFWLGYWLYRRPVHHVQFNNQDAWMVELTPDTAPERLYRPDASITAWRKLCAHARGEPPAAMSLGDELVHQAAERATADAERR
jgi:phenylpropionate dioxygenase-like ring-hydroxylating dioxygenase large terminal subunit